MNDDDDVNDDGDDDDGEGDDGEVGTSPRGRWKSTRLQCVLVQ